MMRPRRPMRWPPHRSRTAAIDAIEAATTLAPTRDRDRCRGDQDEPPTFLPDRIVQRPSLRAQRRRLRPGPWRLMAVVEKKCACRRNIVHAISGMRPACTSAYFAYSLAPWIPWCLGLLTVCVPGSLVPFAPALLAYWLTDLLAHWLTISLARAF